MSTRNLQHLLAPRSLAVIGASDRPRSVGAVVFGNVASAGFKGDIWPVNRRHDQVGGRRAYSRIRDLPGVPDLAIICTPASTIPELIAELGEHGTRAAVVLGAGLDASGRDGRPLAAAMLDAAQPHGLRILGPNCLGLLVPHLGLNASFARAAATAGNIAFVAQSGALMSAVLDWALGARVGFSYLVSVGNSADVDFGDLLDYLCADVRTHAILLYIESIASARKFMSAARAAARNKPVIVVRGGRLPEAAKAAASHTGALAGADDVYDAAFRRAGMLRVDTTRQLFDAAETLARMKPLNGDRLAIVSNGGGPAVMATDAAVGGGGRLAEFTPATMARLDATLPHSWSHADPVDIVGDAPVERYAAALEAVLADPGVDAVLLIHAPTAVVPAAHIARGCAGVLAAARQPALTCWMGGEGVREAAEICMLAGLPTYGTPEDAVEAFLQTVRYQRNQRLLMEAPPSLPEAFRPRTDAARAIVAAVLGAGRSMLTEPEAKALLAAYDIPAVPTRVAADAESARRAGADLGFPVALKILSPDITHKSDVGGVALDIASPEALVTEAGAMRERCAAHAPEARITGFTVQPMIRRARAHELIAGLTTDAAFGPVVLFGQGGTAVELIADRAVALPPLNSVLARDLVSRTRVHKLFQAHRGGPGVDTDAVELTLVKLSQMAIDIAEIVELDINPLLADENGVLALDARVRVARLTGPAKDRLAIRPYPKELEELVDFAGRKLLLRPIRPEDWSQHREFLSHVTPEDMRTRFFRAIRELPEKDLASLTQIDYERAMAFVAVTTGEGAKAETLGVARAHSDPDNITAEFAVHVRSDLKGRGLGSLLLEKLIRYCRSRGTRRLVGEILSDNDAMLHLARASGFHLQSAREGCLRATLDLQPTAAT